MKKVGIIYDHDQTHRIPSIHVPLEGKLGCKVRFGNGHDNSRIEGLWEPGETDRYHPVVTVCPRKVLICLGWMVRTGEEEEEVVVSDSHRHVHRSVGRISGSDHDNVPSRPRSKRDLQ